MEAADKIVEAVVPEPTQLTEDAVNIRRRIHAPYAEAQEAKDAAREAKLAAKANQ